MTSQSGIASITAVLDTLSCYPTITTARVSARFLTYIASADSVHGEKVVAVAKLKFDHVFCRAEVAQLLLLRLTALLDQVFEQQGIFAHPLDGLQQVGSQVHLVPQLDLFVLEGKWADL